MIRLLSLLILSVQAGPAPAPDPRAQALAPFVGPEVVAVAHVDLSRVDVPALVQPVLAKLADANGRAEVEGAVQAASQWVQGLQAAGATDLFVLVDPQALPGVPPAVVLLKPGADPAAVARILAPPGGQGPLTWPSAEAVRGAVVAGTPEAIQRARTEAPARPELAPAMAATGAAPVRVLLVPAADQRRILEEMLPMLPQELGGAPITAFTQGAQWAALTLETGAAPGLRLQVQARDAEAAKALEGIAAKALELVAKQAAVAKGAEAGIAREVAKLRPALEGDRLVATISLGRLGELAGGPLGSARESARRSQCTNNLKQIALAMHNYASTHNSLPPAYRKTSEGKPGLSWRVLILPYLDQAPLYQEFHLDEPWDSPHNKALIARMPQVYRCPSQPGGPESKTTYIVPRGDRTMFPGAEGVKFTEVTDGTSNTILTIDAGAANAVVWTKPDDWEVGAGPAIEKPVGPHGNGLVAAFADGSVRYLAPTLDAMILRALVTRDGGEVIDQDKL